MTHDWQQTRRLLVAGTVPAIEAFFAVHPRSELRAISYIWEWGQAQAAFYRVANTAQGLFCPGCFLGSTARSGKIA
jgi:hypothetical protein